MKLKKLLKNRFFNNNEGVYCLRLNYYQPKNR